MYGQDAYAKSSIKYGLHQLRVGRPDLANTDAEILAILRRSSFSSVQIIADSLGIPASPVYFHLVEKIGFKKYLLRWVPHLLTDEPRLKRVELARQLLELLED
jgi:hypothetical protein